WRSAPPRRDGSAVARSQATGASRAMTWSGPENRLNLTRCAWQSLTRIYADQLSAVPWKVKASYGFLSRYLSLLEKKQAPALKVPPVFIVGHWRSGTTFLHELLVSD